MATRQCFHCKEWVEVGSAHDCWTTTEGALTRELSDDLRDAWERLRETAVEFGEQRIYASHNSIMFAKKACYFFVRPRPKVLELCVFLGRTLKAPQVRKAMASSRVKVAHIVHIKHRDEVEAPLTDWLREAFETSDALTGVRAPKAASSGAVSKKATARTSGRKAKTPTAPGRSRASAARSRASQRKTVAKRARKR